MTAWTSEELSTIGSAEELEIASLQRDGTLRKPVTIWVVRVGNDLYVRPVSGRTSAWFRGTQARHEGHIQAGGVDKDVAFVELDADDDINDQIDAAYRTKYHPLAQYVPPVVTPTITAADKAAQWPDVGDNEQVWPEADGGGANGTKRAQSRAVERLSRVSAK